ncbi:hypothetical protein [Mucilaginibacter sp.]|uniref:hypothetical protein n=1 Tax=Mucilaginibacter sp. TaxID=1882438 RepID=UPI002CB9958B|nr:hypothetical protein [Mucilaginibacter sp.]HTI60765.1 hypothetical protein [Mucilaginibacter sp.]
MKTLILFFLLTAGSLSVSAQTRPDSVYICLGKYSHAYHRNTYCKGLRNCKAKIMYVSLGDAIKKYGRKACGYCYK